MPERRSQITSSAPGNSSAGAARQKKIEALSNAATITPSATKDGGFISTLLQSTLIANPSSTATNFQQYILRITSSSVQPLTWGSEFRGSATLTLPSGTSGSNKTDYLGFQWNEQDGTWDLLAKSFGY